MINEWKHKHKTFITFDFDVTSIWRIVWLPHSERDAQSMYTHFLSFSRHWCGVAKSWRNDFKMRPIFYMFVDPYLFCSQETKSPLRAADRLYFQNFYFARKRQTYRHANFVTSHLVNRKTTRPRPMLSLLLGRNFTKLNL